MSDKNEAVDSLETHRRYLAEAQGLVHSQCESVLARATALVESLGTTGQLAKSTEGWTLQRGDVTLLFAVESIADEGPPSQNRAFDLSDSQARILVHRDGALLATWTLRRILFGSGPIDFHWTQEGSETPLDDAEILLALRR